MSGREVVRGQLRGYGPGRSTRMGAGTSLSRKGLAVERGHSLFSRTGGL